MQPKLNRLKERVSKLSNHHQKYILTIEKYGEGLIERLEQEGRVEDVHLWKNAYNLSEEMDIVQSVARSPREMLDFLGCYYAFQILHLNLRSIDVLMLDLTTNDDRIFVYKKFMLNFGHEFRVLTATYMQKLLNIYFESSDHPEFVICSVGSLAHQDDLDIGIIDDGSIQRTELNQMIGKLRKEMLKFATEMHMYLSEHVGEQNYSASIDEYRDLLDREIGDFVIISEMLTAVPILGNKRLFHQFERKVTRRYYFQRHRNNLYHEGFLRGILGEVRSLLIRQIDENTLNPKDDGLRMLLGMILAGRTIFRIYHGHRWEVLSVLGERDRSRKETYKKIEEAVTFLEAFRHVFQLFVVQEEEIPLDDPAMIDQLEIVAKVLGYRAVGAIKAWDHLLIHYHEQVESAKKSAEQLLDQVTDHLKSVSRFSPMIQASWRAEPYRSYAGNLAIDFLKKSAFFKGTKFWDDILETLDATDSHVMENFISDLKSFKPRYMDIVIEKYCKTVPQATFPMLYLLVKLAGNKRKLNCEDIFNKFSNSFLKNLRYHPEHTLRLTKLFNHYPQLMNDYLLTLSEEQQENFLSLLKGQLWTRDDEAAKILLEQLCELHFSNSHYFKRFFVRIISNYPEYIQYLKDTVAMQQIAKGFLGTVDNLPTFEEKKKQLANYYDLEFLRVGLETINGAPIKVINEEFTEFSDVYLQTLFDICKQKVDEELPEDIHTKDLFAIFTAGGHAREQAFDDDYDILIFLNNEEHEMIEYITKIVTLMNVEIIKRGTMPHYRFTDHFGRFITLMTEIDDFLRQKNEYSFIDKSQILGSRMIVGSSKFEEDFEEQIIKPHIYEKSDEYIRQMIAEIESRHKDRRNIEQMRNNIKEAKGGLRDIEMILLMYKAKYRLREPLNQKLLNTLCEKAPHNKERLCILGEAFNFLKHLRDLYRLTVSADDYINEKYLNRIALIMGFKKDSSQTAVEKLIAKYHKYTVSVTNVIDELIPELIE